MERVLIVVNSGSGKSWPSKKIQEITSTTVIHFDEHFWQAGDLAEIVAANVTELVFLDRDWSECHKALIEWAEDYYKLGTKSSLYGHRKIYNDFEKKKILVRSRAEMNSLIDQIKDSFQ